MEATKQNLERYISKAVKKGGIFPLAYSTGRKTVRVADKSGIVRFTFPKEEIQDFTYRFAQAVRDISNQLGYPLQTEYIPCGDNGQKVPAAVSNAAFDIWNNLTQGFKEAWVKKAIALFGEPGYSDGISHDIKIRRDDKLPWHRNHQPESIFISDNGTLWMEIYWQGDSTDGSECVNIQELCRKREIVIPAEHFFDGERTRCTHDDLRVSYNEVDEFSQAIGRLVINNTVALLRCRAKDIGEWRSRKLNLMEIIEQKSRIYSNRKEDREYRINASHGMSDFWKDNYILIEAMPDDEFITESIKAYERNYQK